eukprot:COSAG02_NODE_133_length_34692_cov_83.845229_16_plen_79_part_00
MHARHWVVTASLILNPDPACPLAGVSSSRNAVAGARWPAGEAICSPAGRLSRLDRGAVGRARAATVQGWLAGTERAVA